MTRLTMQTVPNVFCSFWLTTGVALGCNESGALNEPRAVNERAVNGPHASATAAIGSIAAPAVGSTLAPPGEAAVVTPASRSVLAIAGYYSEEEGQRAYKETHKVCPGVLDGSEMLGRTLPEWHLEQWHNGGPTALAELRGRVVVVRFWTSPGCPFCEKTLPALGALSRELAAEPVTFIGAFHSKPEAAHRSMDEPMAVIEKWGVNFPVAMDPEWKTLKAWWLDGDVHRHATSVTFVIGKDGALLHVHPGPVFHPSDDPNEAQENTDYLAVRAAIQKGLEVASPPAR